MTTMTIREATSLDIHNIIACHRASLPDGVLPALGTHFLRKYYHHQTQNAGSVIIVSENADGLLGFLLLTTEKESLLRHLTPAALAVFLLRALVRPGLLWAAVGQMFNQPPFPDHETSEIAYICVAESARRMGIGAKLIDRANQITSERGLNYLSTKTANADLAEFYKSSVGAVEVASFVAAKQRYRVLRWLAGKQPTSPST